MEDFHEIFNFGIDFVERMYEIVDIPFWKDVLGSLKILLKSDTCTMLHHVCTTPLWYNNLLKLPLKHKWLKKRCNHNRGSFNRGLQNNVY